MDVCYNVGLSGKHICFILERETAIDTGQVRERKRKERPKEGEKKKMLKVVAFSNDKSMF